MQVRQLLMIEPIEEEPESEVVNSYHKGTNNDEIDVLVSYIVHALAGYSNPQTMKIKVFLKLLLYYYFD